MKKKILSLAVVSTLGLGSLFSPIMDVASAKSLTQMNKERQQILNQRSGVSKQINQKNAQISQLKDDQEAIQAEVKRLDLAVEAAVNKIEVKNNEIEQTTAEIEQLKADIVVLEKRIAKRNELLKDRARSLQLTGGTVSYMDVLLGAQSFSDFVDRVSAVTTIVQADKDILEQHKKDKEELESKRTQVETKLANLQQMKKELVVLKDNLNKQIREKNQMMAKLKEQEHQLEKETLDLSETKEILAAQASAIQKAIELEKKRQAEAARQAELARKRAAQKGNSSSSSQQSAPPVSDGIFTWPANGRVTSGLGQRWGEFHAGIDIANKASGVPIVAAGDGVVIRSYYSSSYGNAVFIAHSINGQVYTTVYAHMSNRVVSSGEVVSRGQRIGTMGNTGQSFGQHLHFEVHKGEWNYAKSNAVNPLNYLN